MTPINKVPVCMPAKFIVAKFDKDPDALLFEFTPVDLSSPTCCPYCGSKEGIQHNIARKEYEG